MIERLSRHLAVAALLLAGSAASAAEFTVAAGAGYRRPLAELAAAYGKASGHTVTQVYGHLGQVVAQARESGAIAVVCGDRDVLEAARGLSFAGFSPLGRGRLVVAWRKGIGLASAQDVAAAGIGRVGIADPVNAIYGKAGRQFLDRAGLAGAVDAKLLTVGNVPQVTSYLVSGEVDAGFVNLTDALGAQANLGGFVEVDARWYDPIEIACGALSASAGRPEVKGFADYIGSAEARAILARHGL